MLASGWGKREERVGVIQGSDQMRALVLAGLAVLAGCIIDNDAVRVENFTADTPATFTYDAWTNTVMTAAYVASGIVIRIGGIIRRRFRPAPREPERQVG